MTGQRAPWRFFCIFLFFKSVRPDCGGYREAVSSGICAKTPARLECGMLNKDNVMKGFKCLLVSFFCLVAVSGAQGEMIKVVDAKGSSSFNEDGDFQPWYLVNGSGLNGGDTHDVASSDSSIKNSWLSARNDTEWLLIFDLGAIYDLASLQIWNFNFPDETGSGANEVIISTSVDDQNWDSWQSSGQTWESSHSSNSMKPPGSLAILVSPSMFPACPLRVTCSSTLRAIMALL